MDAASESNETQKGLNQLCMSIISIDQNMYSRGRKETAAQAKCREHQAFKNP